MEENVFGKEWKKQKEAKLELLDIEIDRIAKKMIEKYGDKLTDVLENYTEFYDKIAKSKIPEKKAITLKDKEIKVREIQVKLPKIDLPKELPKPSIVEMEIMANPLMYELEKYHKINRNYRDLNDAQKINVFERYTRYGKLKSTIRGSFKTTWKVIRNPINSFGSIAEYNVDSLPLTHMKCKGTQVTYVSQQELSRDGIQIISRSFASLVLNYWSYILGIRYQEDKGHLSGINSWRKILEVTDEKTEHKYKVEFITGKDVQMMIKDLMFLTRDKKPHQFKEYISLQKCSPQLSDIIHYKQKHQKITLDKVITKCKGRLYYWIKSKDGSEFWKYPKFHMEYLSHILSELQSGKYYDELVIPIIHNVWKFPLECKDTHIITKGIPTKYYDTEIEYEITPVYSIYDKKLLGNRKRQIIKVTKEIDVPNPRVKDSITKRHKITEPEQEINDDYDLTQYIFERD